MVQRPGTQWLAVKNEADASGELSKYLTASTHQDLEQRIKHMILWSISSMAGFLQNRIDLQRNRGVPS
jgi:hypothetical protein